MGTAADQLMQVWKGRDQQVITEDAVQDLAAVLADSPAELESSVLVGGSTPTGLGLRLSYTDVEWCGNDMAKILALLKKFPPPPEPEPYYTISISGQSSRFSVLLALGVLPPEAYDVIGHRVALPG